MRWVKGCCDVEEPGSGGGLVASNSPSVAPLYVAEGRLAWPRRALLRRHKELAPEPEEPPSDCNGTEEESAAVDDDVVACDAVAAIAGTGGVPLSLSLSLSRSSLGDLALHRLNHKLGLRSNSFDDRPSSFSSLCASRSLSTPFSFSFAFSFSAASSLPLMSREGTGGTGGVSPGVHGATIPSEVDGRILELPGEFRMEWKRPCVRIGVVGEAVVESEVPGIRIAGSDFLRVGRGRASEGMSGGVTREGDEGAFSIGGRDGAGVTVGRGVGTCGSPNPGGSAGSGKSSTAPPLTSGMPETTVSETTGGVGGLSPSEARSRSTA